MRLFMATLSTETNTFSRIPTALSGYRDFYMRQGTATRDAPNLMTEALHVWRSRAEALNWEVTESLAAIAEPAGLTIAESYEALADEILSDLKAAGGADMVLLQLHGAMVSEQVEDCEGDLTARVRAISPDAVIGVALDLHCHLTERMMEAADLLICFKEYPHDDATPRAEELFDMALACIEGRIRPVMRAFDCRMVNLYLTKEGEMRRFVDHLSEVEQEQGVLSVSLFHGFPWADVDNVGAWMLVVTDDDAALAERLSEDLGLDFFSKRHEVTRRYPGIDEALAQAAPRPGGPVVLADMGDTSGAGANGDATFLLTAMLAHGMTNFATGIFWDPIAVRFCEDAGEGARIGLRIGGKVGPMSGEPVDIEARVMRIASGLGQHLGPGLEPLGTMVWLRMGAEIDLVINDLRTQVYHPEAFEQLGVNLSEKNAVAVKSMVHFYTPFAAISPKVMQVATPGGSSPDFEALKLTRRKVPYWPNIEDPFAN